MDRGTKLIFSAVKCIFGEKTRAKKIPNMIGEVKRSFWTPKNEKVCRY
jgi:hypothetical protein